MRKSLKLMGMAAMVLLLAVSCKKEKQDEGRKTVFTAGIEQGTGKTYVHDDGSQYGLYWSDGDAIKVNGVECALKSGAGKTSGTFEGDVEEKEKYYAVYPSSAGFAGTPPIPSTILTKTSKCLKRTMKQWANSSTALSMATSTTPS